MNILVLGIPLKEGMAGSLRVRNLLNPLLESRGVVISNLYSFPYYESADNIIAHDLLALSLNPRKPASVWNYIKSSFSFIKKVGQSGQNILYAYDTPDIKTIPLILYAKFKGYKIILDIVEDSRSDASTVGWLNKLRILSGVYLLKWASFYADRVLVLSSHLEELMKHYVKGKGRVVFIPVTVNFENFPQEVSFSPNPCQLFYGGSFAKKDGLECLLRAFDKANRDYPGLQLVLTGKGETAPDFDAVMSLIDTLSSKYNITYLGYLSSIDYYKTLNNADVFIANRNNSMSAHSGFPSKLIEYLATGKAVIVSNVGDVGRFLSNGKDALLVTADDQEEMYEAIIKLMQTPQLISQIGANGRETARRLFDNRKHSETLYEIMKEIT